eukprot:6564865-Prymnesium_polylepis.1
MKAHPTRGSAPWLMTSSVSVMRATASHAAARVILSGMLTSGSHVEPSAESTWSPEETAPCGTVQRPRAEIATRRAARPERLRTYMLCKLVCSERSSVTSCRRHHSAWYSSCDMNASSSALISSAML